jgi:dolichyl-phosphate-mannose--protein O-mannosyl transferase
MKFIEMGENGLWQGAGPHLGVRPWRLASGVFLGLALGTKWSALYFIVFFIILSVLWDAGARRRAGIGSPLLSAIKRDFIPAGLSFGALAVVVYVMTWGGWILTDGGWDRQWAADRTTSYPFIPDVIRSLWHYHVEMLKFHSSLTTSHPYESNAWGWLIQARPTAIYYSSNVSCGAAKCTSAITSIGNPMLWWAAVLAMGYLAIEWLGRRDWRAAAILGCIAAGWLPWVIFYNERTVFGFYTVVLSAFMALAVAYCLGRILGSANASPRRRTIGAGVVGAYLAIAVVAAAFFLPIWIADPISYAEWGQRMWFKSWI